MKWFAVQSVFSHEVISRGSAVYEERVVLYRARTPRQAVTRAKKDAAAYIEANPQFSEVSQPRIFALSGQLVDFDGAEVWSCLHKGPARASKFWADRYKRYSLNPT